MRVHIEVNVAPAWAPLDPSDPRRPMGGTERWALEMAKGFAARGYEVTLRGAVLPQSWNGARLIEAGAGVGAPDVSIGVAAEPLATAPVRIFASHTAQHPFGPDPSLDAVVAVSEYHAACLRERGIDAVVIPGGCDTPTVPERARDRFLYASSPDRGLHRLLSMWPRLWGEFRVPLSITYEVRAAVARFAGRADPLGRRMREVAALLEQPGVVLHGRLLQGELDELRARSLALLYPLDPVLPHSELFGLSVLEACAAGVPPVLSPVDAFPSVYPDVARFVEGYDADEWLGAIRDVLGRREELAARCRAWAAERTWAVAVDRWARLIDRLSSPVRPRRERPWLFVGAGLGSGEFALARPLLEEAVRRGRPVRGLSLTAGHDVLWADLAPTETARTVDELRTAIRAADRVVLASACTCEGILPWLEAEPDTPVAAVHFHWTPVPPFARIDALLHALPETVFQEGVRGTFLLPGAFIARIRAFGPWPPHAQAARTRRRLLVYFGASPAPWLVERAEEVVAALTELREDLPDLEGLYVGAGRPLDLPRWVERVDALPADRFAAEIARSAVVLSHVGIGTLCQALTAGTHLVMVAPAEDPHGVEERIGAVLSRCGVATVVPGPSRASLLAALREALIDEPPVALASRVEHAVDVVERLERTAAPLDWKPMRLVP